MRFFRLPELLVLNFLVVFSTAACAADSRRPNVIFFLVDDWGWTGANCFGSDLYETPNIDRLAAEGVRFTDGYAACTVCSPTRAAFMTGMYPARSHVTDWIPGYFSSRTDEQKSVYPLMPPDWTQVLEHDHTTIAEAMHDAGYRTLHTGKWHLTPSTDDASVLNDYYPDRHGFEVNIAGNQWGAPGSYYFPFKRRGGRKSPVLNDPVANRTMNFPQIGKEGDYLTDVLTTAMLDQVESWKDEPFFVYFPFYNVHAPIQGRPDLVEKYEAKIDENAKHTNPHYAAMVTSVDENIGRVMDQLEQWGIADNTIIFLTGDNGGLDDGEGNPTENHPLREGKGSPYEGGTRVPTIIKWPGATPTGVVCDEPVITIDYYPTILEMTGVQGDAQHNRNVDGVSLVPILKDPDASLQREAIYWHYPHYHTGGSVPHSVVRAGDYRLIERQHENQVELYDLRNDIGETKDLAASMPSKANELRTMLHQWRQSVGAQPAVANPLYQGNEK
mgnify:CR=1 FL=1|tara:strand:+ start:99541 stop:101040 length:1500 start_codon:yes stop_codon:yes gene_type:complete